MSAPTSSNPRQTTSFDWDLGVMIALMLGAIAVLFAMLG
jgi:hypothetical protein